MKTSNTPRMNRLLALWIGAALAAGLTAAGCGSDDGAGADALASPTGSLAAQLDASSTGPGSGPWLDRLTEELGLTDEQRSQVEAAFDALHTQLEALRARVQAGELTREQAREMHQALREELDETLAGIFTEEQNARYQELRAMHRMEGPRGQRGPDIEQLSAALGLDEEQQAAVAAAFDALHTAMTALHEQLQNGEIDRDTLHTLAQELHATLDEQLQSILTAEQYAQLQELRNTMHPRAGDGQRGPRGDGRGPRGGSGFEGP